MAEQKVTKVFVSLLRIIEFLITFFTELTREQVWFLWFLPNLSYICQTKRNLETRLSEHLRCVTNQEIYKSSIAKHCWSASHNFNFHQAKIILKPNHISELDFLENIAIHLNHEVIVNEKIDSTMLSTA